LCTDHKTVEERLQEAAAERSAEKVLAEVLAPKHLSASDTLDKLERYGKLGQELRQLSMIWKGRD
jgi:hypothetical protein